MKPIVQSLKQSILLGLNHCGYGIVKLPPKPKKTSSVTTVNLGGKAIKIHKGNPLCYYYRKNPRQNSTIGAAAAVTQKKYPTAWAVDVGANVGDTMAIIKGSSSLPVICVEGDPACYELLQQNASLFDQVYLFKTFLSDRPGEITMGLEKEGWNLTLTEALPGSAGTRISFDTLDRLVEKMTQPVTVKLLKVDTEGHDMRIIRGATSLLERDKPVITFELNRENIEPLGDSVGDFFDLLVNLGYEHFALQDSNGRLICTLGHSHKPQFLELYQYSYSGRPIYYYDVWACHRCDKDLFESLVTLEKSASA